MHWGARSRTSTIDTQRSLRPSCWQLPAAARVSLLPRCCLLCPPLSFCSISSNEREQPESPTEVARVAGMKGERQSRACKCGGARKGPEATRRRCRQGSEHGVGMQRAAGTSGHAGASKRWAMPEGMGNGVMAGSRVTAAGKRACSALSRGRAGVRACMWWWVAAGTREMHMRRGSAGQENCQGALMDGGLTMGGDCSFSVSSGVGRGPQGSGAGKRRFEAWQRASSAAT